MRLPTLSTLAPLVLLAACEQPAAEVEPGPAAPAIILGGVDLGQPVRVSGTEPFWGIDIAGGTVTYSGVDRPIQTAPNPGPVVQGTMAVITTTTTQNNALVITLIDTDCSDGMSDRVYPLTARIEIGDETLQGCAISTAALAALPPA
ncbi:hypothetical protein GVN24_23750 [Rhizobium sp. CRIBSB]|nr:hypothetical protein [Rhizobium sp. CRIBSB]